jgi:hypothetical protein
MNTSMSTRLPSGLSASSEIVPTCWRRKYTGDCTPSEPASAAVIRNRRPT